MMLILRVFVCFRIDVFWVMLWASRSNLVFFQCHSREAFYGLNNLFVDVVGVDNDLALGKTSLAVALKKQQCKNADIFVVGDTLLDFEVASSIGAKCVFVDWGHYSFLRLSDCKVPVFSSVGALKSFFIQEMELASL